MFKKIYKISLYSLIISIFLYLSIFFIAYLSPKIPIGKSLCIEFIDQEGNIFYQSNLSHPSTWINLEDINPTFIHSLIAIEDQRYYLHHGIDFYSVLRAIKVNLEKGKIIQGASTITQQYASLLIEEENLWLKKLKEIFMALRLETHYTKNEILEAYINSAYFGEGVYGIEDASWYYFNKSASMLDYSEAALLAGILNGPSLYSPYLSLKKANERRHLVLEALYKQNYIDTTLYQTYIDESILLNTSHSSIDSTLYYYRDYILEELNTLDLDSKNGLRIYTTLDLEIQKNLTQTVENNMDESDLQVSSIIVEPYTSKILALAGGKNYFDSSFNRVTQASRPAASTIKPLLYYLAIENGFQPNTLFESKPTLFHLNNEEVYQIQNYGNLYAYEKIPLSKAIALSDNIYALKTHLFLGKDTLANSLLRLGFQHVEKSPSLALGTIDTNIYELANLYSIFASCGNYQPIYGIQSIEDQNGHLLYEHQEEKNNYFDETSCLILNQLLTAPFNDAYTSYSNATLSSYKPTATFSAKTGTTDYDSLVLGYCPDYLIGCWVGYDLPRILYDKEKRVSKQIFYDLAQSLTLYTKHSFYEPNDQIIPLSMNIHTGQLDPHGVTYWFKKN